MATRTHEIDQNLWIPNSTSTSSEIVKKAVPAAITEDGYYGLPMLKRPTWAWEIAWYFFLEGLSSGAFLISSLADLSHEQRFRKMSRLGYFAAFGALLPCPPLLIKDLGRPERFYHMLRVFKPSSPMNLGAWALTAYSLPLSLLTGSEFMASLPFSEPKLKLVGKMLPRRLLGILGIPCALTMVSYPGVLLSTTSTPVWAKSPLLGALFACHSMSSGASAILLAMSVSGSHDLETKKKLEKIKLLSSLCEAAVLAGYLITSRKTSDPLTRGKHKWTFWLGAVGIGLIAPTVIETIRKPKKSKRKSSILSSVMTLVGGLALKWAVTYAGRDSAMDPKAAQNLMS